MYVFKVLVLRMANGQTKYTNIHFASQLTYYDYVQTHKSGQLVFGLVGFFFVFLFFFFVFFQFLCFVGLVLNQRLQFFFCFVPPYIQPYKIKQIHIHLLNKTELSLCVCCCRSSIANMPAATPVACDLPTIKHLNVAYTLY